jgi:hypothetical protein
MNKKPEKKQEIAATKRDLDLLDRVLSFSKPFVAQKRKEEEDRLNNRQAVSTKPKFLTTGKADHVFVDPTLDPAAGPGLVPDFPVNKVWHVCKSSQAFEEYLKKHGKPEFVSVNYDLTGKEKGDKPDNYGFVLDCLFQHCIRNREPMPDLVCHGKLQSKVMRFDTEVLAAVRNANKLNKASNEQNTKQN